MSSGRGGREPSRLGAGRLRGSVVSGKSYSKLRSLQGSCMCMASSLHSPSPAWPLDISTSVRYSAHMSRRRDSWARKHSHGLSRLRRRAEA